MKRLLITGANGMLGNALFEELSTSFEIYLTGSQPQSVINYKNYFQFDLSNQNYEELIFWSNPEIIIHCAAIIDSNYCEKFPRIAFEINSFSITKFIEVLPPSTRFIYISSDAVFPSSMHFPAENELTYAESVYGKSKELGEFFLLNSSIEYTIIRTTVVGYNFKRENFSLAEWIISSAKNGKKISLFEDVMFTPISIWDFAKQIKLVLKSKYIKQRLHLAGTEICSKYDFGIKLLNSIGASIENVSKGTIDKMPSSANRSRDQSLNCNYYQSSENIILPDINQTINSLKENYKKYETFKTWK